MIIFKVKYTSGGAEYHASLTDARNAQHANTGSKLVTIPVYSAQDIAALCREAFIEGRNS